jgi:predicted RNA polymerase sigma factor
MSEFMFVYRGGDRTGSPAEMQKQMQKWMTWMLLSLRPSPVIALNRGIALAQQQGPEQGLSAIAGIEQPERLASYPFYAAAIAELELRRGRHGEAREHFRAALALARNPAERQFLEQRLAACEAE